MIGQARSAAAARSTHGNKDGALETLRALALLSLVGFHASVEEPPDFITRGAHHYDTYNYLAASLSFIRMPLFTVISGFVYAMRPVRAGAELGFLQGKGRRLLLPLISVVTLTLLVAQVVGSQSGLSLPLSEWYRAYLYPYTHFWFLQAMLWVFVTVVVLERLALLSQKGHWIWAVGTSCALKYALPGWAFFSFDGFMYLLPYFLLGIGLHRFSDELRTPTHGHLAIAIALCGLGAQQLALNGVLNLDVSDRGSPLATATGLAATFALVTYRIRIPWLVALGGYSYAAYLFHHFGLSLGKQAYAMLGLTSLHGLLLTKWICGVLAGVGAEHALRPLPGINTLLLGMSTRRPPPVRAKTAATPTTS